MRGVALLAVHMAALPVGVRSAPMLRSDGAPQTRQLQAGGKRSALYGEAVVICMGEAVFILQVICAEEERGLSRLCVHSCMPELDD